jgi:DNA-binding NarL/FixJ family response regulator
MIPEPPNRPFTRQHPPNNESASAPQHSLHLDSQRRLTRRLVQVTRLISLGCTNFEIASILCLSEKTIDNHRQKAMQIFNAHNSAELTRAAFKYGYTDTEDVLTEEEKLRRNRALRR